MTYSVFGGTLNLAEPNILALMVENKHSVWVERWHFLFLGFAEAPITWVAERIRLLNVQTPVSISDISLKKIFKPDNAC